MPAGLSAGDVVAGRFRVTERLGAGGMGIVYRATQLPIERQVALKVLHPRFGGDPRARARFEREARVASALPHPSAVAIHDFGSDNGRIFLAMELLEGGALREHLLRPSSLKRILDIAWQIADILTAAHRVPLVHRDLKPENVFIESDADGGAPRVRIVDFGLAFIADADAGAAGRMTVEGVVTGTPQYLSPEQARGGRVGPATDVYALGCILYELLTNRVPFAGSEMEVLTRQMFAPPPPLRDLREGLVIPTALDELVATTLRKRAAERPTAEAVRSALGRIDPELARAGRARDDSFLLGRAARMVAPAVSSAEPAEPEAAALTEVAVVGAPDPELLVALSANGLAPFVVSEEQPVGTADAIWAPGAGEARITELVAGGAPVLTDTEPRDMDRIAALLRIGVAEVLARPVASDELVRRLERAVRRRRRGRAGR